MRQKAFESLLAGIFGAVMLIFGANRMTVDPLVALVELAVGVIALVASWKLSEGS